MPVKQINRRPKKKIPELSSFTVMISRGTGKVRSLSFSSRFLLWASVIFTLYLVVSGVAISLYLKDLWNETVQLDQIEQLADETEETRRALYQARQRLKLLEDTVDALQGKEKKEAGTPKTEASDPVREESTSPDKAGYSPAEGAPPEPVVIIQGLATKRIGERLSVAFRLARAKPDRRQLAGYLFIIAATASDPPRFWTYPKQVPLKDGVPVDHKRGWAFKVRNYRMFEGNFSIGSAETPSLLSILAYDTSGELILNMAFAIEEASGAIFPSSLRRLDDLCHMGFGLDA